MPESKVNWGSNLDFIITLLGCIVGIGNLWRFSYLCYDNGGGAFVLCYLVAILTVGIPMSFTEIALGQYFKEGNITIWKIVPIFKGIGIAGVICLSYWMCYAMVIFAWTIMYFVLSFEKVLPWSTCDNWWNSEFCIADRRSLNCTSEDNQTLCFFQNSTTIPLANLKDPVREFWEDRLLQRTEGIHDLGGFQGELVFYLFIAYILTYFCIFKGIRLTGKIVYVTAIFPYILIFVLLIRGVTLPGAINGIKYYLLPDFNKLLDIHVWIIAFSQVFYSFGIAFGMLIPMGVHNKFNHNSYRDATLVVCLGALWSFVAGFAVFSVIGFMAHEQQKPVEEVAASGTGLAFLVYPTATLQMPFSHLWSGLFFLMIHMVILDTIFCCYEAISYSLGDVWPKYLRKSSELTALIFCLIGFVAGLPFVTRGGIYIFELFDYHAASGLSIMTLGFCESVAIAYIYGINRFWENLREMYSFYPPYFWKYFIKYITTSATLIILVSNIVEWAPLKYVDYEYPIWAHVLGWILTISSIICIPLYAIYLVWTTPSSPEGLLKKIQSLTKYEPTTSKYEMKTGIENDNNINIEQ